LILALSFGDLGFAAQTDTARWLTPALFVETLLMFTAGLVAVSWLGAGRAVAFHSGIRAPCLLLRLPAGGYAIRAAWPSRRPRDDRDLARWGF